MAKVSQEYLDRRRRQILDGARRCFARDGFQAASMQDVFAETGLSAGAVYRYFSSKEEIVLAIASDSVAEVAAALAAAAEHDPPLAPEDVLGAVFEALERLDSEQGIARLALQVWAEAARSPALAARLGQRIAEARSQLAAAVSRQQRAGALPVDVDPEPVAKVLVGLIPGFLFQRAILGDVDAASFRDGLGALLGAGLPEGARAARRGA